MNHERSCRRSRNAVAGNVCIPHAHTGAVLSLLILQSVAPMVHAQAQSDPGPLLPVTVSDSAMVWQTDLARSGINLAVEGTKALVSAATGGKADRRTTGARLLRAARLVLLDAPLTSYFVSLNHELGHRFRAHEQGVDTTLRFSGSPWSLGPFDLESDLSYPRIGDPRGLFDLGIESGGLEASWVLKDRTEADGFATGTLSVADALAAIRSGLDTPGYALTNLSDSIVSDLPAGDLARYAFQLRSQIEAADGVPVSGVARTLRARSLLNLLDWALWAEVAGLVDHVWSGAAVVPFRVLEVGPLRFVPSLRYTFSPEGPETSARSLVAVGALKGRAYVRWIDDPERGRRFGFGLSGDWELTSPLVPRLAVDYWDNGLGEGPGARLEVGASIPRRVTAFRMDRITIVAGAKTAGYLIGLPLSSDRYIAVRFVFKPW